MNKGITDLIKLIENQTSKPTPRHRKNESEPYVKSRASMQDQFSFQPKINKKSQKISMKSGDENNHRIRKGKII